MSFELGRSRNSKLRTHDSKLRWDWSGPVRAHKPSSVFAIIYLGTLCGAPGYLVTSVAALDFRPSRRAACRAQPPKVREDAAVDSEIAAGRIALFTPHLRVALVSVALALRGGRQSGLSGPTAGPSPAFARHPA